MSSPLETAARLVALADPSRNDREHEREAAAMALVRLVISRGLKIVDPAEQQAEQQRTYRIIRSKYQTWCRVCHLEINEGDRCAWAPKCGCTCVDCARGHEWRAA